jgi:hypothetical protein
MTTPQKKPTPQSGCNTVAQREYCEAQMAHMQERAELQLKATEAAYHKAEIKLNERLAGMNEFRQTINDQATRFVTREELELKLSDTASLVVRGKGQGVGWPGVYFLAVVRRCAGAWYIGHFPLTPEGE